MGAPIYASYRRSGEQDGADPYEEFRRFYKGNAIIIYAFVLFKGNGDYQDLLGKLLPEHNWWRYWNNWGSKSNKKTENDLTYLIHISRSQVQCKL